MLANEITHAYHQAVWASAFKRKAVPDNFDVAVSTEMCGQPSWWEQATQLPLSAHHLEVLGNHVSFLHREADRQRAAALLAAHPNATLVSIAVLKDHYTGKSTHERAVLETTTRLRLRSQSSRWLGGMLQDVGEQTVETFKLLAHETELAPWTKRSSQDEIEALIEVLECARALEGEG